jgi:cupin fold WbuC family metalloprotein
MLWSYLHVRKQLLKELRDSTSGYVRHAFHSSNEDTIHVMAMMLKGRTSIAPHRSKSSGKNYYLILEGTLQFSTSNGRSQADYYMLTKTYCPLVVDRQLWRTLTNPMEEVCVYLEITEGPFIQGNTVWGSIFDAF